MSDAIQVEIVSASSRTDTLIGVVIGAVIGIFGSLVVTWLSHHLQQKRDDQNHLRMLTLNVYRDFFPRIRQIQNALSALKRKEDIDGSVDTISRETDFILKETGTQNFDANRLQNIDDTVNRLGVMFVGLNVLMRHALSECKGTGATNSLGIYLNEKNRPGLLDAFHEVVGIFLRRMNVINRSELRKLDRSQKKHEKQIFKLMSDYPIQK